MFNFYLLEKTVNTKVNHTKDKTELKDALEIVPDTFEIEPMQEENAFVDDGFKGVLKVLNESSATRAFLMAATMNMKSSKNITSNQTLAKLGNYHSSNSTASDTLSSTPADDEPIQQIKELKENQGKQTKSRTNAQGTDDSINQSPIATVPNESNVTLSEDGRKD